MEMRKTIEIDDDFILSSDFLRSRAARCSSDLVYCENGSKRTLQRNDLQLISIYTLFDLMSKQKRFVVDQSESFVIY